MTTSGVLITGTSSGIGRALLEHYAGLGVAVIAVNRRPVPELETQFPAVRFACVDVRSREEVERLLDDLSELPSLFILNAGINRIDNDESFQLAAYKSVIDTNLYGVLNFIQPLTELPAASGPRHLIAISSLAGWVGNPYALGYHTSKKALSACFDVWSKMYVGTDLVFQQVMLGPVVTPIFTMSDKFPPWMGRVKELFSASLEGTARAVARFALTQRKTLFYPWQAVPLYLGMRLLQRLIPGFFHGRRTLDGSMRRLRVRKAAGPTE